MRSGGRLLLGLAGVCAVYVLLLIGLGFAIEGYVVEGVETRMAASLDADVVVGRASVSLLRGRIELEDIVVARQRGGHLELGITRITAHVAPLGGVVMDREPRLVQVRGVDLSLSARGIQRLPKRRQRPPLRIGGVQVEDARLMVMPTALAPELGRMDLFIQNAYTGPIEIRSALDWLFVMERLHARAELPGDLHMEVRYEEGRLYVSSSLFGGEPVVVDFVMPVPEPDALELEKLLLLVREAAQAVGRQAGERVLGGKRGKGMLDLVRWPGPAQP